MSKDNKVITFWSNNDIRAGKISEGMAIFTFIPLFRACRNQHLKNQFTLLLWQSMENCLLTDISAKLGAILFAVVLLATNYGIGVVSFNEMNYQESYAQGPGQKLEFTKPVNLSNNIKDSVYAQVASYGNNVYVVWEENDPDSQDKNGQRLYNKERNYDILIKKSVDGGVTFGKEINLSNNRGLSEHPPNSCFWS